MTLIKSRPALGMHQYCLSLQTTSCSLRCLQNETCSILNDKREIIRSGLIAIITAAAGYIYPVRVIVLLSSILLFTLLYTPYFFILCNLLSTPHFMIFIRLFALFFALHIILVFIGIGADGILQVSKCSARTGPRVAIQLSKQWESSWYSSRYPQTPKQNRLRLWNAYWVTRVWTTRWGASFSNTGDWPGATLSCAHTL